MAMTIEKTVAALQKRILAANFEPITVNMKCNGDAITITPCSSVSVITGFEQIEYYLVGSPSLPWLGGDNLETVAKQLNNYENMLAEKKTDEVKLADLREQLTNGSITSQDEWDARYEWYSDYHKDVYGFRPRDIKRPVF